MDGITDEQFVDYVKNMSLKKAAEMVKRLEDELGVSAAAPVAMMAGPGAAGGAQAQVEEQTEFTVLLEEAGAEKVKVIKVVREITGLGLKEAKDLVDTAPQKVKEGVEKAQAQEFVKKLQEVGAKASMK